MDNDDDDEDDDGTGMEEVVLSDELIGELTDVTLPNGERTFVTENLESNVEDEREEDELSFHDDDDSTLVLRDISGLNDGNIIELQVDSTDEACLIDDGRVYSQLRLDDGNVVYIVREEETSKDATESFDQQQPQQLATTIETTTEVEVEVEEDEQQPIVIQVAESEVAVAGEINNSEINDQSINGLDLSPINNVTSHKIKHNNQTTLDKSHRNTPNGNCKISRINASSNDGGSSSSGSGSFVAISDKPSCRDYTREDDKEENDEDYDEGREVAAAAAESTAATTAAAAAAPKEKPYPCKASNCRKTFPTNYSLKAHQRTHSDEKPFKCTEEECDKRFKTSGDLNKHVRTHTGERPFVCPYEGCGRSFTTSNIRKVRDIDGLIGRNDFPKYVIVTIVAQVHVRTHTGERPFKCSYPKCDKAFASLTNYKNHVRIHSGEKPYICMKNNCGRRFTEYSSLYKHNLVHKEDKPYECDLCHRQYRQNSTLSLHKRTAHKIVVAGVGAAAAAAAAAAANNNNDEAMDASSTTTASSDAKKELEKNLNQSLVEDDEIMFEKLLDSSQDMIISHASKVREKGGNDARLANDFTQFNVLYDTTEKSRSSRSTMRSSISRETMYYNYKYRTISAARHSNRETIASARMTRKASRHDEGERAGSQVVREAAQSDGLLGLAVQQVPQDLSVHMLHVLLDVRLLRVLLYRVRARAGENRRGTGDAQKLYSSLSRADRCYGNVSPTLNSSRIFTIVFALIGIPLYALTLSRIGELFAHIFMNGYYTFKVEMLSLEKKEQMEIERYKAMGLERSDEDIERARQVRRWISIRFSMKIVLFVIPGLSLTVVLPAILIGRVERWTFIEAVYFAFISQTTIGYGDFVAGIKNNIKNKWANGFYQTFLFMWLFLGLSYIAMIIRFITDFISSRKLLKIEAALIQRLRLKRGKVWNDRVLNFKFFQRIAEELQLHKEKKEPLHYSSPQLFLAEWQSCPDLRMLDTPEFEAMVEEEAMRRVKSSSDLEELRNAEMKEKPSNKDRWVMRSDAADQVGDEPCRASEILSRLVLALGYEPPCFCDEEDNCEQQQQQQPQQQQNEQSVYDTIRSTSMAAADNRSESLSPTGLDAAALAQLNANTITSTQSHNAGGGYSNYDARTITQDESVFSLWSTTIAADKIPPDSKWDVSTTSEQPTRNLALGPAVPTDSNQTTVTSSAAAVAARLACRGMRPRSNSEHFSNKQHTLPCRYRNEMTWYGAPAAKEFDDVFKRNQQQEQQDNNIMPQIPQLSYGQQQQQQPAKGRVFSRFIRKWMKRPSVVEQQVERSYNSIEAAMRRDAETFDELPEDSTVIDVIELQHRERSKQRVQQAIEELTSNFNAQSLAVLENTSVADLMRALALITAGAAGNATAGGGGGCGGGGDVDDRGQPLLLDDHQFMSITGHNGVGLVPAAPTTVAGQQPHRKFGTAQRPPEKGLEKLLSLFVPPAGCAAADNQSSQYPLGDPLTDDERPQLRGRRATQGNADMLGLKSRFGDRRFSLRPISFGGSGNGSFGRAGDAYVSRRRFDDHHLIESCPKRSLVQTESRPGISSPVALAAAKKAARRFSVRPADIASPIGEAASPLSGASSSISSFVETDPAGPSPDSPRSRYDRQTSLQTGPIPRWKAGILQKGASAFRRTRAFSLSELDKGSSSSSSSRVNTSPQGASGVGRGSSSKLAISPLAMNEAEGRGMTVSQRLHTSTQKTVTIVTPKSSARGLMMSSQAGGAAATLMMTTSSPESPRERSESGNEADNSSEESVTIVYC
ncbi:unnamed protein product [Trichogramma brassicae]|uniref:Wilms tumor protein homolog n=1 Tax=Trichogramma brassicae TaxID=86971 RepID=A0A6H5I4E4_9HYME|nr:unnamed protein product [Trichogramma brassicae]